VLIHHKQITSCTRREKIKTSTRLSTKKSNINGLQAIQCIGRKL
jgi:hypothetical protein